MPRSVYTARYRRLCKLLIDARVAASLTQEELASRLERPQSYVSKYERGERRLDVVEFLQIVRALDLEASYVVAELEEIDSDDQ